MQVVVKSQEGQAELSVSELTKRVRGLLEGSPDLRGVWVRGEISNVRLTNNHLYFTLKDDGSQLRCAYWNFGRGGRRAPEEGKAALVHGDVRVYEQRGEYQLVADDIIKVGEGDHAARFEELKRKLHAEGLFEEARKVALPVVPKCIAVVTSATTAALQDVLNVLSRRAPYSRVVLFHTSVQGATAPPDIIAALQAADSCPDVDVILLIRGGGSAEDLSCFNDEALARALAEIQRPVVSGVGHEIDTTIVDFIADRRAPTPSAAAELVASDVGDLCSAIELFTQRTGRAIMGAVEREREQLRRLFDRRVLRDMYGSVSGRQQQVDEYTERLVRCAVARTHGIGPRGEVQRQWYEQLLTRLTVPLQRHIRDRAHRFELLQDDLLRGGRHRTQRLAQRLRDAQLRLTALDPNAPLELGFALVRTEDGALVRDPCAVPQDAVLDIKVKQGRFGARRT
jgi:exodeoxyribonuclease VII large subunit